MKPTTTAHHPPSTFQLAAVSGALDLACFMIASRALRDCFESSDAENKLSADEIEKLFLVVA